MIRTVLSIDGGGINGAMPAQVIAHLESRLGLPSCETWDLIAGVSTGGIIGVALAAGIPASELVDLYHEQGRRIFRRTVWHRLRTLRGIRGPKYPGAGLRATLEQYVGGDWLSDARTHLLVTAYDRGGGCLVDGGVGAVSPALFAWREARSLWPEDDILLLSLATGPRGEDGLRFFKSHRAQEDPLQDEDLSRVAYATSAAPTFFPALPRSAHACRGEPRGIIGWGPEIAGAFLQAGADAVDHVLSGILPPELYVRIRPGWCGEMDDASPANLQRLREEASRTIDAHWEELEEVVGRIRQAKEVAA